MLASEKQNIKMQDIEEEFVKLNPQLQKLKMDNRRLVDQNTDYEDKLEDLQLDLDAMKGILLDETNGQGLIDKGLE